MQSGIIGRTYSDVVFLQHCAAHPAITEAHVLASTIADVWQVMQGIYAKQVN